MAAPVFDAASTAKGNAASYTFSHTCTGTNLFLMVNIGTNDTTVTVSSVTYNAVALTQLQRLTNSGMAVEMWYLVGPASGAHNIVVTMSASGQQQVCNAASYTGVDQGTPLGTKATNTGSSSTPSVVVTSAAGELVVDSVAQNSSNGSSTISVGSGQTQRGNDRQFTSYGVIAGISEEAGAASVTMDWSASNSTAWATVGVPLKPVTVAATSVNLTLLGVG